MHYVYDTTSFIECWLVNSYIYSVRTLYFLSPTDSSTKHTYHPSCHADSCAKYTAYYLGKHGINFPKVQNFREVSKASVYFVEEAAVLLVVSCNTYFLIASLVWNAGWQEQRHRHSVHFKRKLSLTISSMPKQPK